MDKTNIIGEKIKGLRMAKEYYDSIVPHHVHAFEGQEARILAVIYTPI